VAGNSKTRYGPGLLMEELSFKLCGSLPGFVVKTIKKNAELRHAGHKWPFKIATYVTNN
jgi:hypothetical protein